MTSGGAGAAPAWEDAAGGGITTADQWRLTTGFVGDENPIASNLERIDSSGYGQAPLGSAMTESSGIFTFPSTGYWLVKFNITYNAGADRYLISTIRGTIDDFSSQGTLASGNALILSVSGNAGITSFSETIVDVTDTANVKVRFHAGSNEQSATVEGSSVTNKTYFTFIRLGDT